MHHGLLPHWHPSSADSLMCALAQKPHLETSSWTETLRHLVCMWQCCHCHQQRAEQCSLQSPKTNTASPKGHLCLVGQAVLLSPPPTRPAGMVGAETPLCRYFSHSSVCQEAWAIQQKLRNVCRSLPDASTSTRGKGKSLTPILEPGMFLGMDRWTTVSGQTM